MVAEEEPFEDRLDVGAFVGFEPGDGFEREGKLVVGAAFACVEYEAVGADVEGEGEVAEHVEGGRGGAGFVAADLGDVDSNAFGEGVLGEFSVPAGGGESFGEAHGGPGGRRDGCCDHTGGLLSVLDST